MERAREKEESGSSGKQGVLGREMGGEIAQPGVLEFAVWRGDRELEEIPVAGKPGLANVAKHRVAAHEAHRRCRQGGQELGCVGAGPPCGVQCRGRQAREVGEERR